MTIKLMPLKIPGTWAVIYNSFVDEDPIVQAGLIINSQFYNEDILSIERIRFTGTAWNTDQMGHALDLGWYPDSDPNGSYRLTLLRENWNNIVLEFKSRNRQEIRDVLEQCLELVAQGIDDQDIPRLVDLP